MRRAWCCWTIAGILFLGGCGGGGSAPVAGTTGGPPGAPPPPGGPPSPPGAAGSPTTPGSADGSGGATPGEGTPMPTPDSGTPTPPPGDAQQPSPSPDGGGLPGDAPGGGGPGFGRFGFGGFGGAGGAPDGSGLPGDGAPDLSGLQMPRQKSLFEQAIDAYRVKNEAAGSQLLLTHFAVTPGAEKDLAQKMAWFPGLRKPALGPRFAIAVLYIKPPRDFEGSPWPIGSSELASAVSSAQQQNDDRRNRKQKKNNNNNNGGGEQPPAALAENLAPGTPKGDLYFHTGELGTKLLEALEAKIGSGAYGPMYKDIAEAAARPAAPDDPNNPGGDPNNGGNPGGEGRAAFGGGPPGAFPGGDAPGGAGATGDGEAPAGAAQPLSLGIVWLGKVETKEDAAKAAEEANADFLLLYELSGIGVSKSEPKVVQHTALVRVTTVKKGELLFACKGLNNVAVAMAREKAGENAKDDQVEKEVARTMEALDKAATAAPLPALTAEQVKGRLAFLIGEKPANPLPVVVEARLYVAKGLLPEAEMQAATISLLGEAEYARLLAKSPGSGMGQFLGSALSLPGMLNLVRGANVAGGVAGAARRPNQPAAAPGEGGEPAPRRSGLRGLLPF